MTPPSFNKDLSPNLSDSSQHGILGGIKPLGNLSDQELLGKFHVKPTHPSWGDQGIKAPFTQPDSGASGRSSSTSDGGCSGVVAILVLLALLALAYVLWPWLQRMGLF